MLLYRRAAAVVRAEGQILLVREASDPYWILPGGKTLTGEAYIEACARELSEEIDLRLPLGQLDFMLLLENFFSLDGTPVHELCAVFTASLPQATHLQNIESRHHREVHWFSPADLKNLAILPNAIKGQLLSPSASYILDEEDRHK